MDDITQEFNEHWKNMLEGKEKPGTDCEQNYKDAYDIIMRVVNQKEINTEQNKEDLLKAKKILDNASPGMFDNICSELVKDLMEIIDKLLDGIPLNKV